MSPKSFIKPPSTTIECRVPLQQQSDSPQIIPTQRRSSRLRSRLRSQSLLERPKDLQPLQRVPLQQRSDSHKNPPLIKRQSSRLQSKQLGTCYKPRDPFEQRSTYSKTDSRSRKRIPDRSVKSLEPSTKKPRKGSRLSAGQAVQSIQRPKPLPLKRPLFLGELIDQRPLSPTLKRYRPEAVDNFVTQWVESSYRERHCQSDSLLGHSDGDLISGRLTKSASNMAYRQDADGFAVPPISASSRYSASSTTGVRNPLYRQTSLQFNDIFVRHPGSLLPGRVSDHVHAVQAERDSPGLSSDQLDQHIHRLDNLAAGCTESQVGAFLNDTIFPNPGSDLVYGPATGLVSSAGAPMCQHLVPTNPTRLYRVTQPRPDLLYGYSGESITGPFTQPQLMAQTMLHPRHQDYPIATLQGLRFPFFAIEFKAAGGTRGDLWVAANQCAGASSACVNAVERLNLLLQEHESVELVDNVTYSVAVDNNTAQLYISWKEDELNYFLQRVDTFLLSRQDDFKDFRKQVRNILDWGKDKRLKQICNALDIILEENSKKAAEREKALQPPSKTSRGRGHGA